MIDITVPDRKSNETGATPKMYSGKLPFRTKPDTHSKIAQAAQQAGTSINAWLEKAAEEKLQRDEDSKPDLSLANLQQTIGDNSSIIFDLVDEFKPQLKSQKTSAMFDFIAAIEKLLLGWHRISEHLDASQIRTITDLSVAIQPLLKDTSTDRLCDFFQAIVKLNDGLVAVSDLLKQDGCDTTIAIAERVIERLTNLG